MTRLFRLAVASVATLSLANACPNAKDWLIEGDPVDPVTGEVYEIVPGAPQLLRGPDGRYGTDDDRLGSEIGDVDLVIRSVAEIRGNYPPPAPQRFGGAIPTVDAGMAHGGDGIPFTVGGTNGVLPLGRLVAPPYFRGHPILVLAFADLDGDGYVGITHLDGDRFDANIEEAEFVPIARRYAIVDQRMASGEIFVPAGGPPGAELDVVLAAVTYAGPRFEAFLGGGVPVGPAIMTRLPFAPVTDLLEIVGDRPTAAGLDALVGPEIEPAMDPDPGDPAMGESYTLRLDGSQPSTDTARVRSGKFVRFAFAQIPDPETFTDMPSRPLRRGFDDDGKPVTYEILHHLIVPDDGEHNPTTLRIVPIDALGNIAALPQPDRVEIVASGSIQIEAPDTDGDPNRETIQIDDVRGVDLVINDLGGRWDDTNQAELRLSASSPPNLLAIAVVDPDVDDSGTVDMDDLLLIDQARGAIVGDPDYGSHLDLDGNGRVRRTDSRNASKSFGSSVPTP